MEGGARLEWKWNLTRRLYEAGFSRKDILELYRLLDWLMRLPEELEGEYNNQLKAYETKNVMPYVTSIERSGRQEGRQTGRLDALHESICDILQTRFGGVPEPLQARLQALQDAARLKELLRLAVTCAGLAEFDRELSA